MKRSIFPLVCLVALALPLGAFCAVDYINDDATTGRMQRQLEIYAASTGKVSTAELRGELNRTGTVVKLAKVRSSGKSWAEIYERAKDSVMIVGSIYMCEKCHRYHVTAASGFVISSSGALVTNFHVMNDSKSEVTGAMTKDGKFFPIKSVLAASRREDIAIVQLDGADFQPLALLADKPVGSPVCVLSHPDNAFYSLSTGIVSRYSEEVLTKKSPDRRHSLAITADFAKGSSGSPVMDDCGNAIGIAASTQSIYYNDDHGKQENLQQVVKYCVPARCVLDLIRAP